MRATDSVLACRINEHVCTLLPVELVSETMRPLPIDGGGAKGLVIGTSIIRGALHRVIDGRALVEIATPYADVVATRFITLRLEHARIALAVNSVLGVRSAGTELAPLIDESRSDLIESITEIDPALLVTLRRARILGDGGAS